MPSPTMNLSLLTPDQVHRFVRRRVRILPGSQRNARSTGHAIDATLLAILNATHARVRIDGHGKTEDIPLTHIHPWFSRNSDLRYLFPSASTSNQTDLQVDEATTLLSSSEPVDPTPTTPDPSTIEPKPDPSSNPYSSLSDLLQRAASLKDRIDSLTRDRDQLLSQLKSNDEALSTAQSSLLSLRKDVQAATSLINDIIPSSPSRSSSNKESSYTPLKQAILDVTLPGQIYPITVIGERIVAHDPSFCSTTDPSDRNFRNLCTSVSWHLNRSPSHFHREARGLFRRL